MIFGERALIFDVDGTLVDSNGAHAAAWAEALRDFGIDRDADAILPLIGMGGDKLLPRVAGISAESRAWAADRRAPVRALPRRLPSRSGVVPLRSATRAVRAVCRADGVRIGIASSAKKEELEPLLERCRVRDLVGSAGGGVSG